MTAHKPPQTARPDQGPLGVSAGGWAESKAILSYPFDTDQRIAAGLDALHRIRLCDAVDWEREVVDTRDAQDWERLVFLHGCRDWLHVFETHAADMPDSMYWRLLARLYTAYDTVAWAQSRFRDLFAAHRPARESAMDQAEQALFADLPEDVRVFRGYAGQSSGGLSWTLSKRIAKFFAYRAQERSAGAHLQPTIMTGTVSKADILCFLASRGEHEVVVDPRKVRGRRRRILGPLKGDLESLIA